MNLKIGNMISHSVRALKLEAVWFIPCLCCCRVPANTCCHKEEGRVASMCSVLWLLIQLASELLAASVFDQTRVCLLENTAHTSTIAKTQGSILIMTPPHPFHVYPHSFLPSVRHSDMTLTWLLACFLSRSSLPLCCSPSYCNSHFSLTAELPPHGKGRKLLMLLLGFNAMLTSLKLDLGLCNASCTYSQRTTCCVFLWMASLSHSFVWSTYEEVSSVIRFKSIKC